MYVPRPQAGSGPDPEGSPDPDPERLEEPEEEPDPEELRRGSALLAGLLGLESRETARTLLRAGWSSSSIGALATMAAAKKRPRTWLDAALGKDPTLSLYLSHCRRPAAGAPAAGRTRPAAEDAAGPGFPGQGGEISPPPGRDAMLDEITARRARRAAEDEAAKRVQLRHREVVLPILGELRVLEDESLERLVDSFSARSNYRMVARALRRYREGDGEALDFGLAGAPWDLVSRYAVFMGLLLEEDLPR